MQARSRWNWCLGPVLVIICVLYVKSRWRFGFGLGVGFSSPFLVFLRLLVPKLARVTAGW